MDALRIRRLSQLGVAWVWFYLAALAWALLTWSRDQAGDPAPPALALAGGIAAGLALARWLSRRRNEIGLVPLGSIGLTLFGIEAALAWPDGAQAGAHWLWTLFALGFSCGIFRRPLSVLVLEQTAAMRIPPAGGLVLNALFMAAAVGLARWLSGYGVPLPQLLLTLVLMNAAVAVLVYSLAPEFLMRLLVWLMIHLLYRVRVQGLEHIPDRGPVLVTCNHVSFVDALIIGGSIQRPVRFVMYHKIFRIPVLSFIFRTARAIPIAPAREDEALLARAYEEIDQALANGEVVGLFPEGALTPDGETQPFRSGIERILARRPAPVVPMALRGLWAGMWSRRDSRLRRARLPRRIRARIELIVDAPLPPGQVTAAGLEARVRELRGPAA